MASGNLPALPPNDMKEAILQLYIFINQLRFSLDNQLVLRGDLVIDLATRGLILKDTQGTPHYWRVTVNNSGVLVTTDLGTSY
jgi:hypothetical protein